MNIKDRDKILTTTKLIPSSDRFAVEISAPNCFLKRDVGQLFLKDMKYLLIRFAKGIHEHPEHNEIMAQCWKDIESAIKEEQ